jgi:hypothetical protein
MRLLITAALTTLAAGSAAAGQATIGIEIPRLAVAEYHKPYVAFWLESADGTRIVNLAVWYDTKLKNNEGTKWLKDVRQWWRRIGRELTLPADGVSSPTRPPGHHEIVFDDKAAPLKDLAPGSYQLSVEAAREVGGREVLRIPFEWPAKAPLKLEAQGGNEITAVTLTIVP